MIVTAQRRNISFQVVHSVLFLALFACFLSGLAHVQTLLLKKQQIVLIGSVCLQD